MAAIPSLRWERFLVEKYTIIIIIINGETLERVVRGGEEKNVRVGVKKT